MAMKPRMIAPTRPNGVRRRASNSPTIPTSAAIISQMIRSPRLMSIFIAPPLPEKITRVFLIHYLHETQAFSYTKRVFIMKLYKPVATSLLAFAHAGVDTSRRCDCRERSAGQEKWLLRDSHPERR